MTSLSGHIQSLRQCVRLSSLAGGGLYFPFVSLCLSHVSVGTGRTTLLLYRRVFWWWGALVCPPCLCRCQCEEQGDALQSGNSFSGTFQDSLELSRSKEGSFWQWWGAGRQVAKGGGTLPISGAERHLWGCWRAPLILSQLPTSVRVVALHFQGRMWGPRMWSRQMTQVLICCAKTPCLCMNEEIQMHGSTCAAVLHWCIAPSV